MHRLAFLILFLAGLVGCAGGGPGNSDSLGNSGLPTGNSGGNPATRPSPGFTELEMKPATSTTLPPPAPFLKGLVILDSLIEISEVRMFLRDLQLEDGSSFFSGGPFVVRLIRGDTIVDEAFPEFGSALVPQGFYDQTDVGFEILTPGQIPPELEDDPLVTGPLVDHSIVVEGRFKGPLLAPILGQWISFRFVSNQTVELRVETPNDFELNASAQTLFIAFKVRTWLEMGLLNVLQDFLENLSLEQILQILNGLLILDTQSSDPGIRGIALTIESNINASLRFALSPDDLFAEGEVDETSFSFVLP